MSRLAVITPSFSGDYELCADLSRSVLRFSPDSVQHHLIVPRQDMDLFGQLAGPRTHVHDEAEFLPRSVRPLPGVNFSINLRRPFPPLRGWIIQQIVKLAAAAGSDADAVVLVDSDIEFCRPFSAETFVRDEVVRFYRKPKEIDERLPRHVIWHQAARRLLGLPQAPPPYTDYVSSLLAWDPSVLRSLLQRVEATTKRSWATAVGGQLHFSEWTLYGVYVDEILGAPANSFSSEDTLCHSYWDPSPLDQRTMADFLAKIQPEDIAVMVSAKSRTPLTLRREAMSRLADH
ncbi:DUF6492 family protein [Dactylosporangium sp. NPDC000555]|uniref:DUF6492 family protein n=1 Tax=Dactylosporangium sp. NPDC000555 TaxID=3154260 RepID=UPI00331C9FED